MLHRAWARSFSVLLAMIPALATANSLRFFGNGVNDIDRAKILIDDPANTNPGPPADIGATDFTIEFWIKGALADNRGTVRCGNTYGWIDGNTVLDRDRYNQPRSFGISLGNGRVAFGTNVANWSTTLCGVRNVLDGAWHHVAVVRERNTGTMRIYVDGQADGTVVGAPGDISYPDNGVPGNYCNGSCAFSDPYIVVGAEKHDAGVASYPSFRGFLDEVRLSTTARYLASFVVPTSPFTVDASTAALYHFDEASGTAVGDAVGLSPGVLRVGGNPVGPLWSSDSPFPEGGAGSLALQAATYSAAETAGTITVTVERAGGSTGSASVAYQTIVASATPGADYEPTSGTLNWANGDVQRKSFTIAVLDDAIDEPDETVTVQLTGASGATLGSPAAATITIVDDEVTLQHGSLRFASAIYSAGEGSGAIDVTVNRFGGTDGAVSVNFATGTGTALADADFTTEFGTLSWGAGDATARIISIPLLQDADFEGTESFSVTLTAPGGGAALATPSTTTISITDDDVAPTPGGLRFSSATYAVGEGAGSVVLTVERVLGSDGAIAVNYASNNGSATSAGDYTPQIGSLSWNAGDATARTITVPILDDMLIEGTESFGVTLTAPTGGAALVAPSSATVSIADDDVAPPAPGLVQFNAAAYQVAESGGSIVVAVRRVNGTGGAISVSYATANGSATTGADYTASSGLLSWPAGDASDKTFSISIATDAVVEGNETVNLTLANPTGGASLGAPAASVLTITDSTPNPGVFGDAFERPNGAALGNGWVERDATAFSLSAGRAAKNSSSGVGGDALVYRPAAENSTDVEIAAELRLIATSVGYPQVFARLQTAGLGTTGPVVRYVLYVNGSTASAVLARELSGGLTTLATINLSPRLNTTEVFRLRLRTTGSSPVVIGAFVERSVSGSWQIIGQASVNDSSTSRITAAGSTGFGGYRESGYNFDNFTRSILGAGSASASTAPSITDISPSFAMAGESGLIVVVSGAGFTPDSRVRWNGVEHATTFISPNELEVQIGTRDLARAGTASLDVFNPGEGGGLSSIRPFTIGVSTAPQNPAAQ